MSFRTRLCRAVVAVALVVGVGGPAAAAVVGEDAFVPALLVFVPARLWLVVACACAVAVSVCARGVWKVAGALPLVAVVALTWTGASYYDAGVRGLRVGAWNLAKGQAGARADLVKGLAALDADVVCVSEAGRYDWLPGYDVDALARDAGYSVVAGGGETRALSKLPFARVVEAPLRPGPERRPLVIVDVDKQGQRYRVGCLHLMPHLLFVDDSIDRGDARTGSWPAIFAAARAQSRTLLQAVVDNDVDVVAGDWNNQPYGKIVGDVVGAGYADVFAGADPVTEGRGLLARRIDHVLVAHRLSVRFASALDGAGSDHAAVVVEVGPQRGR